MPRSQKKRTLARSLVLHAVECAGDLADDVGASEEAYFCSAIHDLIDSRYGKSTEGFQIVPWAAYRFLFGELPDERL